MSSARKRAGRQKTLRAIDDTQNRLMQMASRCIAACDMAVEMSRRHDTLYALLKECAPHVFSAAEAEHLIDGFRPQRRPLDDLAERVHAALGPNIQGDRRPATTDLQDGGKA